MANGCSNFPTLADEVVKHLLSGDPGEVIIVPFSNVPSTAVDNSVPTRRVSILHYHKIVVLHISLSVRR